MPKVILASMSPRRREMLTASNIPFQAIPAHIDETLLPDEPPEHAAQRLAQAKAIEVAKNLPSEITLGADTLVCLDNQTMGKPDSPQEAENMLGRLAGRTHRVITGVCLIRPATRQEETWYSTTYVTFKKIDRETIQRYMQLVETRDKAGAYAIQEHGDMLIANTRGLVSNVIGLPIEEVEERLQTFEF